MSSSPCPPGSPMNLLARSRMGNNTAASLKSYPTLQIAADATFFGKTPADTIDMYQECIDLNPVATAPPLEAGRKRSQKHKHRRGSRSKHSRRSRRSRRSSRK